MIVCLILQTARCDCNLKGGFKEMQIADANSITSSRADREDMFYIGNGRKIRQQFLNFKLISD